MMKGVAAAAAAWIALGASGAQAATTLAVVRDTPCLYRAEAQGLMTALAPGLLGSLRDRCAENLPATAYLRVNGDALIERYRAPALASLPLAAQAMGKITGAKVDEATFATVADALVPPMLAKEIKPRDCGKIDRAAALLDPLPPENFTGLIVLILELGSKKDDKGPFPLCNMAN